MEWKEQAELFNKAHKLDRQEKFREALEILYRLDKEELPEAQSMLGFYYMNGRHVAKDAARAEELFKAAGDAGYAPAYYHLARWIEHHSSFKPAKEYYLKSAEGGYMIALSHIAFGYENHNTWDEVDMEKSFEYHKAASDAGHLGSRGRYWRRVSRGEAGPWRRPLGYVCLIATLFQLTFYGLFRLGSDRVRIMDLRTLQKYGHEELYK